MPLYFFHVHDGVSERDHEGTELEDWDAARRHAVQLAGKILDDAAHSLALGELWHMEVTDAAGLVLFRLDFHITLSPSLLHSRATQGKLP